MTEYLPYVLAIIGAIAALMVKRSSIKVTSPDVPVKPIDTTIVDKKIEDVSQTVDKGLGLAKAGDDHNTKANEILGGVIVVDTPTVVEVDAGSKPVEELGNEITSRL